MAREEYIDVIKLKEQLANRTIWDFIKQPNVIANLTAIACFEAAVITGASPILNICYSLMILYNFNRIRNKKEIFNSHWCLVLKDFGNTFLVVPMVSLKIDSAPVDKNTEMIVKIKNFEDGGCSKLKIHQMFCGDAMRVNPKKKVYNLQTDFEYVKNKIKDLTNLS